MNQTRINKATESASALLFSLMVQATMDQTPEIKKETTESQLVAYAIEILTLRDPAIA